METDKGIRFIYERWHEMIAKRDLNGLSKVTAKTFEIIDPLVLISANRPSRSAQTSYPILDEWRSPTYFRGENS
jgi:hypothetical protein